MQRLLPFVQSYTVNGAPLCTLTSEAICHPPTSARTRPLLSRANGISQIVPTVSRLRMSTSA